MAALLREDLLRHTHGALDDDALLIVLSLDPLAGDQGPVGPPADRSPARPPLPRR